MCLANQREAHSLHHRYPSGRKKSNLPGLASQCRLHPSNQSVQHHVWYMQHVLTPLPLSVESYTYTALRERLWENTVTHCLCEYVCAHTCVQVYLCLFVCYSVLIWLCSQMTVPLYNMTLKCAKCGVISSADVSTTATSNAMLVPLIIFP